MIIDILIELEKLRLIEHANYCSHPDGEYGWKGGSCKCRLIEHNKILDKVIKYLKEI